MFHGPILVLESHNQRQFISFEDNYNLENKTIRRLLCELEKRKKKKKLWLLFSWQPGQDTCRKPTNADVALNRFQRLSKNEKIKSQHEIAKKTMPNRDLEDSLNSVNAGRLSNQFLRDNFLKIKCGCTKKSRKTLSLISTTCRQLTSFPHKLCKTVNFWTTEKSSFNSLPKGALKLDLTSTRVTKEGEIYNSQRAVKEIHSVGQQDRNNKNNKSQRTSKATEQKETHVFYWSL